MRALGAILLVVACGGVGFGWTLRQKQRIALLEALRAAVQGIGTELTQRGTPLPEILEGEARRSDLLAEGLSQLAKELRRGKPVVQAAAPLLEALSGRWELPQAAQTMEELCQRLGRYDAPTQGDACVRAAARLEQIGEEQQRVLLEKGRLYHTVPLALGAMAALVIW